LAIISHALINAIRPHLSEQKRGDREMTSQTKTRTRAKRHETKKKNQIRAHETAKHNRAGERYRSGKKKRKRNSHRGPVTVHHRVVSTKDMLAKDRR